MTGDEAITASTRSGDDRTKWSSIRSVIITSNTVKSHFKVVRNSFPFSIPTELYERLSRL